MTIAFTICSNNYLGHAKTLKESYELHNPGSTFLIGLVDKLRPEIDYKGDFGEAIVVMSESIVPGYDSMVAKYKIVELNTSVKPFFFQYLITQFKPDFLHYLDPDIKVYQHIGLLDTELAPASLLLTPHFYTPIPDDGLQPFENLALNYGTFNLGYLGINAHHPDALKFLDWWGYRTKHFGFSKTCDGFFVDQLWVNLAPTFFKDVVVTDHFGCNMGPWNLHERTVAANNSTITLDGREQKELVFFHFSSYSSKTPDLLSKLYDRYTLQNRPDLQGLYKDYLVDILKNKCDFFASFPCLLNIFTPPKPTLKSALKSSISHNARRVWKRL